jgi:glutathione-specific gamma-glutamylcyclotransferase
MMNYITSTSETPEAGNPVEISHDWVFDAGHRPDQPLWVFGYGSLMWNPGFVNDKAEAVLLRGYHRRFCVFSHRYRGTPERPGLVLGLDRGGACWGMAFRVPPEALRAGLEYLWQREMVGAVYKPVLVPLRLQDGAAQGLTFRVRRAHRQYCGSRCLDNAAQIIASSAGPVGTNREYLDRTIGHLRTLGIRDAALEDLAQRVEALAPACV